MYKVLIIDDEEPARKAIKMMGDWGKLEVAEIFEAQNGIAGLKLLREHKPDVVLIDMKMPEMNGVEFLKISQNQFPDILTIIISGYEDFEYTKQAIKSQSVDYLLKPVNRKELNAALSKAMSIIQAKRESQRDTIAKELMLNISLTALKEKAFRSVIDGIYDDQLFESYSDVLALINGVKSFGVALIKIMNLTEVNSKYFNNNVNLLYSNVLSEINQIINDKLNYFSFRNSKASNEIICIITSKNINNNEMKSLCQCAVKQAVIKLKKVFKIEAIASIGEFYKELKDLRKSYICAETRLNSINLLNTWDLVFCEVPGKENTSTNTILSKKNLIKKALESESIEFIYSIISEYIDEIKETGYFSMEDAYRYLNEFSFMINDIALEYGVPYDEISEEHEYSLKFSELNCSITGIEDFEKLIYCTLDYNINKFKDLSKAYESFNIHDIKDYIDKKYFEDINISLFTEKYFFSKEYLLKLFKKQFGYGIYEYLLKVRMDKAKALLSNPEIKIRDISNMLGYNDYYYFTKAFKKYNGITPSNYRECFLNK